MTTYNTGNALGSSDPRDLYDNAQNLDNAMNSTDPTWIDRFGVARPTFKGAESELNQKVGDAEAAATQALGYLNTMRATSYGPLAEDPTTDPLGHPCTAGDEYFNTTYNLLKRFDGSIWRVPDINTENLASGAGSSMVGHGGQTVEAALNERLPEIGTYALLRSYNGPVTAFMVRCVENTFDGGAGVFRVKSGDTTSADNGGTILVDAIGRRWFRDDSWAVNVRWFGAVGDGVADDTTAIQAALNRGSSVDFPDGIYKITSPLTVNSATRRLSGRGTKTVIAPYLSAGQSCFDLTVQAVRFEIDGFYFNLPAAQESNITAIKFSSATFANRGNTVRNIWINGLQKGFTTTSQIYARLTIENWNHTYLVENTAGTVSIDVTGLGEGNTVFLNGIDIIGGFEYGVKHSGRVFCIRDFNISGSGGTYLVSTAIQLTNSATGIVEDGWIEQLVNPGNTGDQPAIYLDTCQAVSLRNVNVAQGSVYLKDGIGNTLDACQFANATGGIRTVGFPDFSINACNQIAGGSDYIAWFPSITYGRISVSGYNNRKPKRGYLSQAASLMTTAPTRTNVSLVTLSADTTDYLLGTQSQLVTTTVANQGVQFAFTGLLASTLYTFVCFVKSTTASDGVIVTQVTGNATGYYPRITKSYQTCWSMLSFPMSSDSSGNLTVKVINEKIGSFKIDCAQLWLGYRLDEPEQTLP